MSVVREQGGKQNMKPKYVVYECEEDCQGLFYREVEEVLTDDGADCHVKVKLVAEKDSNDIEEFPMCECVGGDGGYHVDTVKIIPISE